jgi:iron complex outermembrane receptor protein
MGSGARSKISIAVAAALASAVIPRGAALADEQADSVSGSAPQAAASGGLQEVVVTARKRTENLQDVPISIEVFTQQDLQHLAIENIDDYMRKVSTISYISEGPGSQFFVIRGVSDGSDPDYSNTSATGFFLDDMSITWQGVQPDLHLYDVERIEVLEGPQGTTFGAGSMAGAVRYITNKPDLKTFSAGTDLNTGKIQGGQQNWTVEGFVNIPLIDDVLGVRLSGFDLATGGFINNQLTTRNWENGTVSDNSPWAGSNYNHQHVGGGRIAVRYKIAEGWSADLIYSYQKQTVHGAWDEDPTLAPRTVSRFGPEGRQFEAKTLDFHVDGDLGIADLVFASTYWALPTRQVNEYSQYIQNYKGGEKEGFACLNDPVYGTGYAGCNVPLLYYEYHTNPERWSNELRVTDKGNQRFHWLVGGYWEKTEDQNSGSTYFMPGIQPKGAEFQYYANYYGTSGLSLPPGQEYAYTTKSDYLQTTEFANISFDVTKQLTLEAGVVHFQSYFSYFSPYQQFTWAPTSPSVDDGSSHSVNARGAIDYKITDQAMVYTLFSQGFRDGGSNSGFPNNCYQNGVPHSYVPDTLNNYEAGWKTTWLNHRLVWNGAQYLMEWQNFQTIIYDADICLPSSFYANVGTARIIGTESNIDWAVNENLRLQANANYVDSHLIKSPYPTFQQEVGERLPFVPYFAWSWNGRYQEHVNSALLGYLQFDMSHKGDMWNNLHVEGSQGFPRLLQPPYTLMNLRIGLSPEDEHWTTEFYITNLTDKNAIIYSNTGNFDIRLTTNEPRVFGLRLSYRWGK